jgi:NitT/TauT family transport system permease protein
MPDETTGGRHAPPAGEAAWDAEEARRARAKRIERVARWLLPLIVVILTVVGWDLFSSSSEVRERIFPRPGTVWDQLVEDRAMLFRSLLVTLEITLWALAISILGSVLLAILFTQSRFAELIFFPYAVVLQVTPIVSIAPLIFIYVTDPMARVLICAWIVAFFPLLANTTTGLKSTDHNLSDLYQIYGATWWQKLFYLKLPFALPFFLAGLRIAGGLALIGAIVAEYVTGLSGSGSGLAFRILEANYRYNYPRMFAALILIALVGVIIFALTTFLSWFFLRKWHESAVERDG